MKIGILKGDGVGPEIMASALLVLKEIEKKFDLSIACEEAYIGGSAIDRYGVPLPEETIDLIDRCDAILLGAVGGPKWDHISGDNRPEKGLLMLRKHLKAYCNLRPIIGFEAIRNMVPIKLNKAVDICFVRELTGGIYFGERYTESDYAWDQMAYSKDEVKRIAIKALEISKKRNSQVTSVDKSNVLASSKLWRETVKETVVGVELNHLYVDNAAMQLIINPHQFDVILTSNMFGDILSDEASILAGSIGILPSASIGDGIGLYEPIHGSAPDIANQDKANPIGMILSLAMMFKYSFDRDDIYDYIFNSVDDVLNQGYGTGDLYTQDKLVTTSEWTQILINKLNQTN